MKIKQVSIRGRFLKMTPEQATEAAKLYICGLSIGMVAEYYGVTRQSMWQMLKRRITLRPQKRNGPENHFYRGGSRVDDHAQNMAEYAVRRGIIQRSTSCEECGKSPKCKNGRSGVQAHHNDYNKPLEVRWLCKDCHHEWHRTHQAIRKVGG